MKLLDVVHPAAKVLVDISLSQDSEVQSFDEQHDFSKAVIQLVLCMPCFMELSHRLSSGWRWDDDCRAAGK